MNFIVGQPLYEINGSRKPAPSPSSVFTVVTKCRQCSNQFVSKLFPRNKPKNEFETIKLGDIFTNYSPQKSPSRHSTSEKNESDGEDDLCSQCSTVYLVSSQTKLENDYDPMTSQHHQDSSNSDTGSNNNGITYANNGRLKVDIPESIPYLRTTSPGSTSAPQTSVIASNHNGITHNRSNGVMTKKAELLRSSVHLTSPLPVSVVLPNGLGNTVPTTSTNHISSHVQLIGNNEKLSNSRQEQNMTPFVIKSEPVSTNEIPLSLSTIRITSVTTGTHSVQTTIGSSALSLVCTLCNKNFKNEQFALAHNEKVHSKVARYTCPTCHGKFCYRGALNSHISFHHPQLASYNCSDCGKKFKEKSFLNAHHTIVHAENPRIFKCEFCPSAFSKKVNLNYHRKRKHPEQTVAAATAIVTATNTQLASSDTSTSKMNTQFHQSEQQRQFIPGNNGVPSSGGYIFDSMKQEQQQSSETYELNTMSSSVTSIIDTIASNTEIIPTGISKESSQSAPASGIIQPKKTSTPAQSKPEGDFKCQYCGRGFLFRNNLKCHLRTHIRDKKYTCEICEKSFIYKESLKNHMLLHSNELPYHCDICGKKFRDRSNRRKHVKNVHKFLLANGGGVVSGTSNSPANYSTPGNGNVVQGTSTSGAPSTSPPKRKPKRPPAKKKDPLAITPPPPLLSSTSGTSPPPPKVGVIVSPKPMDYQSQHNFPIITTQSQRQESLRFERDGIIVNVKSDIRSPGSQESQQQQEYHHHHQQQQQLHQQHEQQLYLPPSMHHPNVIVYPKPKLENLNYTSPPMGSPESHASYVHSVISSHSQQHPYYESYSHQQHGEAIPSYVSLMAPPQSISPETNTTGSGSYDSPASPYVINMSMLPPGARLRSNSTGINHPGSPNSQSQPQQQYSTPPSTTLMYSSPMMGTTESGESYQYWIPSANQSQGTIRPYYNTDSLPITVTEGTLLNPQSSYVNTPSTSTHTPTTTPSNNHFYTDVAQFDFSHF